MEEVDQFRKLKVYRPVLREVMEQTEGAIMLSTKWVITNKGTWDKPKIKARYVGR